jgi:arabinofuranosyltransferase
MSGDARPEAITERAWRGALAAVAAVYLGLVVRHSWLSEDAFISFRYARNLAEGRGLVFNPGGVPTEGYSNFLWMLLAACFQSLGVDVPLAMVVVSTATGLVTLAMVAWAARTVLGLGRVGSLASVMVLAAMPPFVVWSTSGLETLPFTMCFTGTALWFLVAERRATWALAVAAALALSLLRIEGIAWVAVLAVGAAAVRRSEGRPVAPMWGPIAAIFGAWGLYTMGRLFLFDAVWASTVVAKLGGAGGWFRMLRGARYVTVATLVFCTPVALLGTLAVLRHQPRVPRAAWMVGLALAAPAWSVLVGGDYERFFRFLVPAAPFLALSIGMWVQHLQEVWGERVGLASALALAVVGHLPAEDVVLTPQAVLMRTSYVQQDVPFRYGEFPFSVPTGAMAAQPALLAQMVSPGQSVVLMAIGRNGYFTDVTIVDQCSLVERYPAVEQRSRARVGRRPGHDSCLPPRAFRVLKPDYLAFRSFVGNPGNEADALMRRVGALRQEDVEGTHYPEFSSVEFDGARVWGIALRRADSPGELAQGWAAYRGRLQAMREAGL